MSGRVPAVAVFVVAVAAARAAPILWLCAGLAALRLAMPWAPASRRLAVLTLASALAALLWWRVDAVYARALHPALDAAIVSAPLRVAGPVVTLNDVTRFTARLDDPTLPRHVRVSWRGPTVAIDPGACWHLRLRFDALSQRHNPGAFDRRSWLLRRGIAATARVLAHGGNRPCQDQPRAGLDRWRAALSAAIGAVSHRPDVVAVLRALTLGERGALPAGTRELLTRTGTAHLVAISGLHVGMVSALGYAIGRRLFQPFARGSPIAQTALALLLAAAYAALSGFALPARRALLMLIGVAIVRLARRPIAALRLVALAAIVVSIASPALVADASFQFSFLAVTVLALCAERWRASRPRHRMPAAAARMQIVLGVLVLPATVFAFGYATALSVPANLVAVPVFSLVVVPVSLAGVALSLVSTSLAELLWQASGFVVALVIDVLQWLSAPGWGVVRARLPDVEAALLATALLAWAVLATGAPGRWTAAIAACAVLWAAPNAPSPACARVAILAVGHGTAIVTRTPTATLVYDTGPAWPGGANAVHSLLPFLDRAGVAAPEFAILSHADRDHTGGAGLLAARGGAHWLVGPGVRGPLRARTCAAGQRWSAGGVGFEVLWPVPGATVRWSDNDRSCVLRIRTGSARVLLTGDIEARSERELVALRALRTDAITVPHHGSRTSSTPPLVAASQARLAIVSADAGGRWSLPAPMVAARWHEAGARLVGTGHRAAGLSLCADRDVRLQDADPWAENWGAMW